MTLKAPIGSHFRLVWTTDAYVNCTNEFEIIDNSTKQFPGRPPKKKAAVKGTVTCHLSIVKDGEKNGYRPDMPPPQDREIFVNLKYRHEYSFIFVARHKGVHSFKVEFAGIDPPIEPITKEIEVIDAEPLNDKRADLLALIDKWLPSSVLGQNPPKKVPPGETEDIMEKSGWGKKPDTWTMPLPAETIPLVANADWKQSGATITGNGMGQTSAAKRSYNDHILPKRRAAWDALPPDEQKKTPRPGAIPVATSCNDVMGQLINKMWGSTVQIDVSTMVNADPAYYVKAVDEYAKASPNLPKPGDILFFGLEKSRGEFQHDCILISRSDDVWLTADGGDGGLPDQSATINNKPLSWTDVKNPPQVPMFVSPTDGKKKALHGWVDLDRLPNPKYNADGSRK